MQLLYKTIKINSNKLVKTFIFTLLTFTFIACSSCKRNVIDGGHPLFIKAQSYYEEGKYEEAIELYKKYLKINPDSAKTNFQLGTIYQEQEKYIQAIFYYEKYLDLKPDSSDKDVIEKWISSSKKQLLGELEKKYDDRPNAVTKDTQMKKEDELIKELDRLKRKNEKMKEFIIKHKDVLTKDSEQTQKSSLNDHDSSKNQQIYIVEPGDTYYGISKKIYGTAKYYKLIWDYNRKINPELRLKPGDKLIIPTLPESIN